MARREIKSHKKATDLNLTKEFEDLLGMSVGSDSMKLKSADDLAEPDEKVEKSSVAAVEATINYVNKLLNESDEDLPTDDEEEDLPEDPEDQVDDEEPEMDDGDELDTEDDDVDECNRSGKFCEDDDLEDDADPEEDEDDLDVDDGDETLDDMEDEDEDLDDEEDMDDVSEGYRFLFEDDESLSDDGMEDDDEGDEEDLGDDDMDDEGDEEDLGDDMGDESGLSIDIPEDIDPNDVSVSVGGSEYVPDVDDVGEDEDDEDLGDLDDDELGGDEDEEDMNDVQEGYNPFAEAYYALGEDDDPDMDDADPEYDDSDFDDEEDNEDLDDEDVDLEDDGEDEEVTEATVMRALRKLIREGERSDDPITVDPSDESGDDPIDKEGDIDDSEAEEDDLSGDEGEVTDGDIPITPGTIQPEEAAELKWMARKLKKIMEGDDLDSHSDGEGKLAAEPLDGDAEDMIGDISDELSDDSELTDIGNGAVEDDGETTLGDPDDADDDVEVDGDDVVSSNGEKYEDTDEDEMLTDNYHMLMTAIKEAYAKKKGKKVALKKVAKKDDKKKASKKKGKKLSEGYEQSATGFASQSDYSSNPYAELGEKKHIDGYASTRNGTNKAKTLENTVLGSFNAQEMTSVLRNLNNAFGTGKIAKEVRDSSVVSEVSVPKWSLPIAENASWDSIKAGKMLMENAFKSESKVDFDTLKKTHLYWENDGSKESDYKFPIASIVEGRAQIIPEAINEATALFASPSFITRFSESALKKIRNVLDFYNGKMGKKSPWKENKQLNVTEAARITMIDRTQYNPYAVLKRLSEQEKARNLINLRG